MSFTHHVDFRKLVTYNQLAGNTKMTYMIKNKPKLMIHTIEEWMFSLPLENYELTFDDGLYNHFYYIDRLVKIPTKKVFFISSSIICNGPQSSNFCSSEAAHEKARVNNREDFMTIDQIKQLAHYENVEIGSHSHFHTNLNTFNTLAEKISFIKNDTTAVLEWFGSNLGVRPVKYCFPYNDDLQGLYKATLLPFGFTEFYGRERIPIETLQHI